MCGTGGDSRCSLDIQTLVGRPGDAAASEERPFIFLFLNILGKISGRFAARSAPDRRGATAPGVDPKEGFLGRRVKLI